MQNASTPLLVSIALSGFAANSLLCRAALGTESIDAFSFTATRVVAGAVTLIALVRARGLKTGGSWRGALALYAYAICFALAYQDMTAATGALLLFATVQLGMMGFGLWRGERLSKKQKFGFAMAIGGLFILTLPGVEAPRPGSALLMLGAGAAWASYSLLGRGSQKPLIDTASNFLRASPLALAALCMASTQELLHANARALLWSVLSGVFASGLAYAVWYKVLPRLDAWQAGVIQLLTPVLAALGAVVLLGESLPPRVIGAAACVLLGLFICLKRMPPRYDSSVIVRTY